MKFIAFGLFIVCLANCVASQQRLWLSARFSDATCDPASGTSLSGFGEGTCVPEAGGLSKYLNCSDLSLPTQAYWTESATCTGNASSFTNLTNINCGPQLGGYTINRCLTITEIAALNYGGLDARVTFTSPAECAKTSSLGLIQFITATTGFRCDDVAEGGSKFVRCEGTQYVTYSCLDKACLAGCTPTFRVDMPSTTCSGSTRNICFPGSSRPPAVIAPYTLPAPKQGGIPPFGFPRSAAPALTGVTAAWASLIMGLTAIALL